MKKFSIYTQTHQWLMAQHIPCVASTEAHSTNDLAKAEAFEISEPLKIYLADQQTHGRGRGTNLWLNCQPGAALILTYSVLLDHAPQSITAPLLGLSIFETLSQCFPGLELSIKPPNDIYLGTKKILGLLIEALQQDHLHRLIIGVGINIFLHPESAKDAGHLATAVKIQPENWNQFLQLFHQNLLHAIPNSTLPHMTESQRHQLLLALNHFPLKKSNYLSVSPFGDLATDQSVISWRDL